MAKAIKPKPAKKATAARTTTDVQPVAVEEPVGRYINPLTDFGFKHIFGTKEFLIDFLNTRGTLTIVCSCFTLVQKI